MSSSKKSPQKQRQQSSGSSSSPSSKAEAKTPPTSLEIQDKDLKASGFSCRGIGTSRRGPPGGAIYEKASSRHKRHREVYKTSVRGQEIASNAVPLGGSGKSTSGKRAKMSTSTSLMKRKAILDAAKRKGATRKDTTNDTPNNHPEEKARQKNK